MKMKTKLLIAGTLLFTSSIAQADMFDDFERKSSSITPPTPLMIEHSLEGLVTGSMCSAAGKDMKVLRYSMLMTDWWFAENERLEAITREFNPMIERKMKVYTQRALEYMEREPVEAVSWCNMEHLRKVQSSTGKYSDYIDSLYN
jgi:hypothetical protein